MADRFLLDLVNHPQVSQKHADYAGFCGLIIHAQRWHETGQIEDTELGGPGLLECDVAYTGLRRIMVMNDALPPIPVYPSGSYVFAGYDVGKFDIEYGTYSLIINYALDGRRTAPPLNRFLLFDRREDAESLLSAWQADPDPDKESFLADEILAPHAVYRQVSGRKG